ncbi:DNA polymerase gamma [Xylariaceae sp. FL0804]|nr:DNA polymerase gamma [Xylariaceae sp. FL0804]
MLHPAKGHVRGASAASFVRLASRPAQCRVRHGQQPWPSHARWRATTAALASKEEATAPQPPSSLADLVPSEARFNEIGVQHLSSHMYRQIFPNGGNPPPADLVELSKDHLRRHDLLGKNTDNNAPIAFDVPPIQGQTMDEHFHKLGMDCAEPFLSHAKQYARETGPPKPREWVRRSGWTKYFQDGRTEPVDAPDDTVLTFDIECLWKQSPFAVMACAMSPTAWYAWLSPWLLGESETDRHLIPLGDPTQERVIVGHNIGFDRARILEEYDLKQTRNAFLDTMSLHVAVNGMCSRQRPTWMKHRKATELRKQITKDTHDVDLARLLASDQSHEEEQELWLERSSINSLRDVAKFHLNVDIDKGIRDDFSELDREGVFAKLDELLNYCAADVAVTHRVYKIVFPNYLETCPHPVSFAALRHLSSVILPVDKSWQTYLAKAEATYQKFSLEVQKRLHWLVDKAVQLKDNEKKWKNDPWLQQLDWSGQEIKMTKGKKNGDPPQPRPRQKLPGMPKWYKSLFATKDSPINITLRSRITPLLLRLAWDGYPLHWSDKYGWTFRVPLSDAPKYSETQLALKNDTDGIYFKLPHKDGPAARCANPMAKGYLAYFDKGMLSSEYSYAKKALELNASCSYWMSARDRITSQMVVYESDKPKPGSNSKKKARGRSKRTANERGYILPQVIPMGTVTRRAVENTWLTASNAKKNRVGSELKAMIKAPPGYSFVGADVDSEELWIASVIGDAIFKLHGGNAIGFMTLEGTKAAGTDLHSRTASILGITRNDAKVFNYGRIYGAGLKFASTLLRQFNPGLSEAETMETAGKLYANTKGTKTSRKALHKRPFWRGGTESFVFNKLEEFAEQERPRTPVLGAGITQALMAQFINKGAYLTSRVNWAIQSSGVDYLHLLIVSMDYLIRRFNIEARLAITVHDEIRYLVKDEDRYRAAMALQIANLWTRAMFAQQIGIDDLPQACAYFSAVDVDHVLRKEVDMDCVTPSHAAAIPPGESLDMAQLLAKGREAYLDPAVVPEPRGAPDLERVVAYEPRVPVMEALEAATTSQHQGHQQRPRDLSFLRAQISSSDEELRQVLKEQRLGADSSAAAAAATAAPQRRPRARKSPPVPRGGPFAPPESLPHMYEPFGANFTDQDLSSGGGGSDQWVFEELPRRTWKRPGQERF